MPEVDDVKLSLNHCPTPALALPRPELLRWRGSTLTWGLSPLASSVNILGAPAVWLAAAALPTDFRSLPRRLAQAEVKLALEVSTRNRPRPFMPFLWPPGLDPGKADAAEGEAKAHDVGHMRYVRTAHP
jgi:hypothetical protein